MELDHADDGAEEGNARSLTILGSTGSVGCNTVDLVGRTPEAFSIEALTGNRNAELLAEQARRLKARLAVVGDPRAYRALKEALWGSGVEVAAGREAVIEAACRPAERVMASIVGAAGLEPTLAAIRRGAVVALANKECLVSAGELMVAEVESSGATLIPVDSEHSAIFQVFDRGNAAAVEKIVLTASGGPFRTWERAAMAAAGPAQAVAHPNWDMGAKISVDSATMMNKGLELIEAYHLFPVAKEQIEILVHPQSVVHSMVAYVDGSVLAQMGSPDMRTPIAFALAWPRRMVTPAPRLRLDEVGTLTFEAPDPNRFPALRLARRSLEIGGTSPTILNAANEVAVHGFLSGEIGFLDIARIVEETLEAIDARPLSNLADAFAADEAGRQWARSLIAERPARAVGSA
jgi:1-deoxy-D-xylulose-5-phosphate reductoisomerase